MVPKFFDYDRPNNWCHFHEGEFDVPIMTLRFRNGPALSLGVACVPEDKRAWLAETLHRQIASIIYAAEYRGESDVVNGMKTLMRIE